MKKRASLFARSEGCLICTIKDIKMTMKEKQLNPHLSLWVGLDKLIEKTDYLVSITVVQQVGRSGQVKASRIVARFSLPR